MNDPLVVRGREQIEDLSDRLERVAERHWSTREALPKCASLEELHDEERGAILHDVVVEDGDRTRMFDLVRDVALAEEPLHERALEHELRAHALDRDAATVPVARREDMRHSAGANQIFDHPLVFDDETDVLPRLRLGESLDGLQSTVMVVSRISDGRRGLGSTARLPFRCVGDVFTPSCAYSARRCRQCSQRAACESTSAAIASERSGEKNSTIWFPVRHATTNRSRTKTTRDPSVMPDSERLRAARNSVETLATCLAEDGARSLSR